MATKAKSGKHGAPAAIASTATETEHSAVDIASEVKAPAPSRRRRPPHIKESPELIAVVTIDERLKKLSRLPSLQKPLP